LPEELFGVEIFNLVALLGFCVLAVLVWRWLPLEYSLFVWPNLAVLLARDMALQPLLSTGRYVLVIFPCFMVLGILLARHRRAALAWLAASAVLYLVLFQFFVRWKFVA
jgi:hypothetical protein